MARRLRTAPMPPSILPVGGTQAALLLLIPHLVARGGRIAVEALTHSVAHKLFAHLGLCNVAISMDDRGLVPAALHNLCKSRGVDAIYINPSLHNPTTSTLSVERLSDIAEIAAKFDVQVIEDDVMGALADEPPATLRSMIPDRHWYISGLGKAVALGLRCSFVVAPDEGRLISLLDGLDGVNFYSPTMFHGYVAERVLAGQLADLLTRATREELAIRHELAADVLSGVDYRADRCGPHLWLPASAEQEARIFRRLDGAGVHATGSASFCLRDDADHPHGIRLSLTSTQDREALSRALLVFRSALG
ncbi:Aminotransferase class I and II [Paraburkholderia aspalathi]|uniref:Aminotransferase class I and II n=2 Tax=Paraburkholderia aspalathi TaxID=1324617 RepID=A0A1I7BCN1_9BURK|nr:Aminotransferase class I and II [Paraburkholderia aspalathi]